MKASEIRQLTPAEIETKMEDLQKEYLNLRFGMATQQLESSAKLRTARRDIARMLTIINEKGKKA
jgi:large subunit ribosomal protein L29